MSTKKKTLGETLVRWEALNTTLKQHQADLPQAGQDQADFEILIAHVKELANSEDSLLAQLREATRTRLDEQTRGRALRNRLTAQIQGKFGLDSERLLAFGVLPRKIVRRPRKVKPAPEIPAPTQAASSASKLPAA